MFTPDIEGMGINIARGLLQTIFTFSKKAFNESLDFCNSSKPNLNVEVFPKGTNFTCRFKVGLQKCYPLNV